MGSSATAAPSAARAIRMWVLGARLHVLVDDHADGFLPRRDVAVILGSRFLILRVLFLLIGRHARTVTRRLGDDCFGGPLAAVSTLGRTLLARTAVTTTPAAATAAA